MPASLNRETREMKKKAQTPTYEFGDIAAFAPMSAFNGPMSSAMIRSSQLFAKSLQAMPAEVAGFIGRRVEADAKLYSDCAHCDDWQDLVTVQQKWLKQTSEDYLKEMNQMMAISQSLFSDAAKVATQATKDMASEADEKASPTE